MASTPDAPHISADRYATTSSLMVLDLSRLVDLNDRLPNSIRTVDVALHSSVCIRSALR